MNFKQLFKFLQDLEKNNNKAWMDANRSRYETVRDSYIEWLNEMDIKLAQVDKHYKNTTGKQAINRINNNLLYHPNKPIYKDHFGAGLDQKEGHCDFYLHLGTTESFIGGGFYKPKPSILKSIRQAIDYNGDELKEIIQQKSFTSRFSELIDDGASLKTAPKGFSQDHKHIALLRKKTFAVHFYLTQKEVMASDYQDRVIAIYKDMLPFRQYLNQAVSV